MSDLAPNGPLISEADMCWLTICEAYGYNPECPWENGGQSIPMWGKQGIAYLHPEDANRSAEHRFIWGNFAKPRMCVGCRSRYNNLVHRRNLEYQRQFPNGPQPVLSFNPNNDDEMKCAINFLHASVIERVVKRGGMAALHEHVERAGAAMKKVQQRIT